MTNHAVELDQIRHVYGDRIALDGVTLKVESARVFGLLGPNGGGKTTLFKVLSTALKPTFGTARVFGDDVQAARDRVRSHIGVVFQSPSLDPHLTVLENLTCQGAMYSLSSRELHAQIPSLLQRFGLADRARDRVKRLSGGLQRRVELAKSLLHSPKLLVLDEPSSGLDPEARRSLMDLLHELRDHDGVTSLITTHLGDEADRCDRVAIIDSGKIVADGTPAFLKEMIGGDVITIRASNPQLLCDALKARFGLMSRITDEGIHIERAGGHRFVPELIEAFPGQIESISVGKPTLDDVFLRLTGHGLHHGPAGNS